ncbi:hypothetical protein CBR_g64830 [Chara braunii]|uniref:Uncharacterized protein n=1 Tax=Chara braunii TaxID=69332 RepID=A0A388K961_CHABU|nr:hypothetical protein CBR_g64830 [Chara braunii]|eukprot:GBG66559.1 hypothetical protein CBR_g64830 [Chara braunii]
MGVESIVVKHAREEVSKGHVGFVGEGGCKIFVAYSLDAGDERKFGNDGGGEVMAEGADVLDKAVRGTGLAEVTKLFEVVIDGFLGAEGGNEKVGPLEKGVTRSSGGATVADFGHPPFGGIAEEAGGGDGKPVDKGHVVELERVLELGKEEENILMGKAGEGHDVGGSEGTGNFPFAGNDPGEGVEAGSVVAGAIELAVVIKEVVGGKLWHCGVNPGGDLGIGGTRVGMVEVVMMGCEIVWECWGGRGLTWLGKECGGVLEAPDEGGGGGEEAEVVDVVVEVVGVEEVDGGVWLEAVVDVGVVVVTTWMEGVVVWDSRAVDVGTVVEVTRLDRSEIVISILVMDPWMSVWKEDIMRMRVAISVATGSDLCSPISSRARLSTDWVLTVVILMLEDWAMLGEDGVDAVAEATAADELEADAATAAAAARWEVLVWRGGMWRFGSGKGWGWGGYL